MADPMNREQAVELKNSPHWKYVENEIQYRIDLKMNMLRRCQPGDLKSLQMEVDLLEEIKRLPDDVADRESDADSAAPLAQSSATPKRRTT